MNIEDEIKQKNFTTPYQKVLVNILFTSGWLNAINHHFLKPYGISSQQYNILRILRGQHPNPVTISLLQERMLDRMSNASRLVEKLRQKGFIKRTQCDDDRRRVDVIITDEGLALLKKIDKRIPSIEENVKKLSEKEANQLSALLDKLRG